MPQLQGIIPHQTFPEHVFVTGSGLFRLREVIAEIGPDEFVARAARGRLGGGVDIRDLPVPPDCHQRIEAGFDEAPVVGVGQSQGFLGAFSAP